MIPWRRLMYNLMYRLGTPRWDTGVTPPEVVAVITGAQALPAGRALDLGCGTGTNVRFLAQHGWAVVGVDFSPVAIRQALQKVASIPGATVVEGDVSRLSALGVQGPFDFVLDMGCFHGLADAQRTAYIEEVARVARPGALFLLWAIAEAGPSAIPGAPTMRETEVADRFGRDFIRERVESGDRRWKANWYTLRRR